MWKKRERDWESRNVVKKCPDRTVAQNGLLERSGLFYIWLPDSTGKPGTQSAISPGLPRLPTYRRTDLLAEERGRLPFPRHTRQRVVSKRNTKPVVIVDVEVPVAHGGAHVPRFIVEGTAALWTGPYNSSGLRRELPNPAGGFAPRPPQNTENRKLVQERLGASATRNP